MYLDISDVSCFCSEGPFDMLFLTIAAFLSKLVTVYVFLIAGGEMLTKYQMVSE